MVQGTICPGTKKLNLLCFTKNWVFKCEFQVELPFLESHFIRYLIKKVYTIFFHLMGAKNYTIQLRESC